MILKELENLKNNHTKLKQKEEISFNQVSAKRAYEHMQKIRNVSSYAQSFGKEAEADHDSSILIFKRLKDVACSQILDARAYQYFDKWLSSAKETYYKDLLMRIIKSIYVYAQSKEPAQTLHKNSFSWTNKEEISKPPRIDKLKVRKFDLPGEEAKYIKFPELKNAKPNPTLHGYKKKFDLIRQEAHILSKDIKRRTIIRNPFNNPEEVTDIPTDLNQSKIMKGKLLKGSGGFHVSLRDNEPIYTHYQQSYKGANVKYPSKIVIDDFNKSSMLSVSPDPYVIGKTMKRSKTRMEQY